MTDVLPRRPAIRRLVRFAFVAVLLAPANASAQGATRYRAFSDLAEQARVAGTWAEYARLVDSVYAIRGNHPSVLWARARADARLGRTARAIARLQEFASAGLARDLAADSAFLPLATHPAIPAIRARLAANATATARTRELITLGDSSLLPEGLAFDPATQRLYTSSIRRGLIMAIGADGSTQTVSTSRALELWALMGIAIDAKRRTLWVASQQMPHYEAFAKSDSGRTAVAAIDLDHPRRLRRLVAPVDGVTHAFGDLTVLADGTVVVSDGMGGMLFSAALGDTVLRPLVSPGLLVSPQGIAAADGDRVLYVADYALGIVRIDRASGRVERLAHADAIIVTGVDGLIRVGRTLVGVQNGTNPKRVVRFDLDRSGRAIVRAHVLESNADALGETTQLTRVRGEVYVLARTGLDQYSDDGVLAPGSVRQRPVIRTVGTLVPR